jgi:hypothetical protein
LRGIEPTGSIPLVFISECPVPSSLPFIAPLVFATLLSACNHSPASRDSAATLNQQSSTPTDSASMTAAQPDSGKIELATARQTALAKVPGAKVVSEELEQEGGHLVYSFDLRPKSGSGIEEVQVDAHDGSVVSLKHETPSQEADESRQDQKNR